MAKLLKNQNVAQGTLNGAIQGGAYGAAVGFVNSAIENHAQNAADRRARKFQAEQAEKQFNRQRYFDNLEKRWNSEQAQVQRFRDAGLNPNLMYGDLSASTAQTPSVPMSSTPNGVTRDFSIDSSALQGAATGIDEIFKAASVDNLNQNTAKQYQDTVQLDIENKYKETMINNELLKQLAEVEKMLSEARHNDADTKTLEATRDALLERIKTEITLNTQKTAESAQNVESSKQGVAESKQRVKESKQRIDESKQNINESKSRESLNKATEILKGVETKDLLLKYHLSNDQYQMINDFVHKHNLPPGSEKAIIDALHNFAESSGETVPKVTGQILESWLDGGNWLNYLVGSERNEIQKEGNQLNYEASEHRTDAIKQGYNNQTEDETPQRSKQGNEFKPEFDRAYTPQQKQYIMESRKYWQYLDQNSLQQYYKMVRSRPKMTQLKKAEYVRELYYNQYGTNKLPDED